MTLQTSTSTPLTTNVVPPATPTLSFTPNTAISTASPYTILDGNASVADGGNKLEALRVSLSGAGSGSLGVVQGNALSSSGTIGNIDYSYSAATRILSLTDRTVGLTATGADFTNALRLVGYSAGASPAGSSQEISINIGRPVYSADNGHYYEFVSLVDKPVAERLWTTSRGAASTRNFLGLTGYLATVTSQAENDFMNERIKSKGWIGGSSEGTPGDARVWKWVTGPEGQNGGTTFWNGNTNGTLANGQYQNWEGASANALTEPNNFGNSAATNNEPYAHFLENGKWNDLADSAVGQIDTFTPNGYWVEYSAPDGSRNDGLAATRTTFSVIVSDGSQNPNALDLVFYDELNGQVSFAFIGSNNNIVKAGLDLSGDTPKLVADPSGAAPVYSNLIQMVSANVDVDRDNIKDIIVRHTVSGRTYVVFGEPRTGSATQRAYAYKRVATVTLGNGVPLDIPNYSIDFASDKLGVNNTPGLYWRNAVTGDSGIHSLTLGTGPNGAPIVISTLAGQGVKLGPNSGWRPVGDGEFNNDPTTREIFWVNDLNGKTVTWSLGSNRQAPAIKLLKAGAVDLIVPTKTWRVSGIGDLNLGGNDEVVWQSGTTVVIWKMNDSQWAGTDVVSLPQADRIKAIANTEIAASGGTETLELVGQNDVDGTVGYYKLNFVDSASGGKYTINPARRSYTANNAVYRPGKGSAGIGLELVNVAQYDNLSTVG